MHIFDTNNHRYIGRSIYDIYMHRYRTNKTTWPLKPQDLGLVGTSIDLESDPLTDDLMSTAGFLLPGGKIVDPAYSSAVFRLAHMCVCCIRMALNEARRLKLDSSVAVVGLPCASFSIMWLKCTNMIGDPPGVA